MAEPVSLAFVTSLPRYGGGEKWMLQAAEAMAARGHHVSLISQPGGEITRRAYACGLTVYPVRMGGWLDPSSLWEIGRVLSREKVQVACVNIDKEIRQVGLAGLPIPGFKVVARRGSPDTIKNNWHYRLVYERFVDRLICNCEALVEKVCADAPWLDRGKVRVIHNGCDTEALRTAARPGELRRELGLAAERPLVTCVGEVGWRKGQELLLAAAQQLRGDHPEAVFLIAGEGDGRLELEQQSRRLGLDDGTVRFLGFRDDVPTILADSDILVLPSRREGFPNALLEGMALGLPVIATPVDGIPELIVDGQTGQLVPVDDSAALAAALGRLLKDSELRRRWGEAGNARVRDQFSTQQMNDLLEDCLTRW